MTLVHVHVAFDNICSDHLIAVFFVAATQTCSVKPGQYHIVLTSQHLVRHTSRHTSFLLCTCLYYIVGPCSSMDGIRSPFDKPRAVSTTYSSSGYGPCTALLEHDLSFAILSSISTYRKPALSFHEPPGNRPALISKILQSYNSTSCNQLASRIPSASQSPLIFLHHVRKSIQTR